MWEERIHQITTNAVIHRDRENLVRSKIRDLQEYYTELGEDIQVEYEGEEYRPPPTQDGEFEDRQVFVN